MIKKSKVLVGTDVEVMLRDLATGKYKSAEGLIGGSKDYPRPLDREGCALQEDNVSVEYNVPPVGLEDSHTMAENIQYVMDTIKEVIPQGLAVECCSSARFDKEELSTPHAQQMGCDPDFNAWKDGDMNEKPDGSKTDLRSCGGHIAVSCPGISKMDCLNLIKWMDIYLGVPSVLIDTDKDRRTLYGKAGAFRTKLYGDTPGVEYRTLSNWWTKSEDYIKWVFLQLETAIDAVNNNIDPNPYGAKVVEAINTGNEALATELCQELHIDLPLIMEEQIG
jgi:hypothetical protein